MKLKTLALGLVLLGAVGCGSGGGSDAGGAGAASETTAGESGDKKSVVVSGGVVCDLTKQVAADDLTVTCLMEPGQDPHAFQLTSGDRRELEDADLIVYGGYMLEEGLIKALEASGGESVAVYEEAVSEPLMGEGHDHHEHGHGGEKDEHGHSEEKGDHDDHDHAAHSEEKGDHDDHDHAAHSEEKGEDHSDHDHAGEKGEDHDDHDHAGEKEEDHSDHDHAGEKGEGEVPDPHVWHDAELGAASVKVIGDSLAELDPENAAQYQERAAAIAEELGEIDGWIQTQIETIPEDKRQLVTAHDAFRYYAAAYGLEVTGTLSGMNHENPSAQDLARLTDKVKDLKVPAIFSESLTTNLAPLETVAKAADVKLAETPLFVDGPGDEASEAPSYQEMLEVNTCAIADALGGKCTPRS
ncbi:MAG: zinc ABC transporter substrate-binding protein [Cyanobacteria bacterium P01_F01_bin.153]